MKSYTRTKLIHEGLYAAEVDIELIESDAGWSPTMSLDEARKLDEVRNALREGDIGRASRLARVFQLMPVSG